MATKKTESREKKGAAADVALELHKLQEQLQAMTERLAKLEAAAPAAPAPAAAPAAAAPVAAAPAPVPAPAAPAATPEITEEEILVVSAALAAYLGVRLRIRQIRLVSSAAWAQMGRVSIQASHHLHS